MAAGRRSTIRFAWVGEKPEGISVRAWREALKAGWYAVGVYYDEVVQPRKFEADAASRYGYQPRTPKYAARKKRLAAKSWRVKEGGQRDIVYSGVTRTAVKRKQYPRAFYQRVTVDTPTPAYVQMRPRRSGRPNLGAELTSVSSDERAEMERIFKATVEAALSEYRGGRRR